VAGRKDTLPAACSLKKSSGTASNALNHHSSPPTFLNQSKGTNRFLISRRISLEVSALCHAAPPPPPKWGHVAVCRRTNVRLHMVCRCCTSQKKPFCNLEEVLPGVFHTANVTRVLQDRTPCANANSTVL
jgi:hypothetical protein